ncbi:hypothetical protein [Streptomyces sp. JNUCC 63]
MKDRALRKAGRVSLGLAGLAAVLATPATASATPQSVDAAASCYGGSVAVSLPPDGYSKHFTTSSRCADINLRIDSGGGQWVAVCWAKYNTCQKDWTWSGQGAYKVIASDVKDGTEFYFVTTGGGGTRTGRTAF